MPPADAVRRISASSSRALAAIIAEIFVAHDEKVGLRDLEVLIIHYRPGRSKAAHLPKWAHRTVRIRLDGQRPENARHVALIGVIRLCLHVPQGAELMAPGYHEHLDVVVGIL